MKRCVYIGSVSAHKRMAIFQLNKLFTTEFQNIDKWVEMNPETHLLNDQ